MQKECAFGFENCRYLFYSFKLHGKGELRDVSYETSYYKHVDPHDILTVIIHFGNVKEGGETVYYKGTEKMQVTQ